MAKNAKTAKDRLQEMTATGHTRMAEGEATGHAHRGLAEIFTDGKGDRFCAAESENTLTHEEHKAVTIPPLPSGLATAGIVREYDHLREEERNVVD